MVNTDRVEKSPEDPKEYLPVIHDQARSSITHVEELLPFLDPHAIDIIQHEPDRCMGGSKDGIALDARSSMGDLHIGQGKDSRNPF